MVTRQSSLSATARPYAALIGIATSPTDFGSVSHRAPAALIGVGRPEGWAFHTDQGATQFASPAALDIAADMAAALALAAVRLSEPTS